MKFLAVIVALIFYCDSLGCHILNENSENQTEPKSLTKTIDKPSSMNHGHRKSLKINEFVDNRIVMHMNRFGRQKKGINEGRARLLTEPNSFGTEFPFAALNSTENASVKSILDRVQKNYEKLQQILQNKSNSLVVESENTKDRVKRSIEQVENETDVEYTKYGGYISTKVYLPLEDAETTSQSSFENNAAASSTTEKPRLSSEVKEIFIGLMDDFANDEMKKNTHRENNISNRGTTVDNSETVNTDSVKATTSSPDLES